jgi:hypothetical protein
MKTLLYMWKNCVLDANIFHPFPKVKLSEKVSYVKWSQKSLTRADNIPVLYK